MSKLHRKRINQWKFLDDGTDLVHIRVTDLPQEAFALLTNDTRCPLLITPAVKQIKILPRLSVFSWQSEQLELRLSQTHDVASDLTLFAVGHLVKPTHVVQPELVSLCHRQLDIFEATLTLFDRLRSKSLD